MKFLEYLLLLFTPIILCVPFNRQHSVSLIFVGDIVLDGFMRYHEDHDGTSTYSDAFKQVAPIIKNADVAIANLESPVGTEEMRENHAVKEIERSPFLLAAPHSLKSLEFAGFDAVTLANNHMNDFGDIAVNLTVRTLNSYGIGHFGINYGNQPYASQVPWIKEVKGIRLGFLGYDMIKYIDTPNANDEVTRRKFKEGMALFRKSTAKKDIAYLQSKQVDVIVVYMHWGETRTKQPVKSQKTTAAFLRNIGVHIIVGCHSHTLQGHSFYKNSFIAYSLGNFVFGPLKTNYWKFFSKLKWHEVLKPNANDAKKFESLAKNVHDTSRILKIEVTKDGAIAASYLPCYIEFNTETKSIHVAPSRKANWIDVCASKDEYCLISEEQLPIA